MAVKEGARSKALREARGLLQSFGFNGFSFQHIADALGIKKPSLYDHFKSKEELGQELVKDYHQSFVAWTETVDIFGPKEKIGALFELFFKFSCNSSRLCPLSALIGDFHTLPSSIKKLIVRMLRTQKDWITRVIEQGLKNKVFRRDESPQELAELVMSIGLGSQLMARVMDDPKLIKHLKDSALEVLAPR